MGIKVPSIRLSSGFEIPLVGLGTYARKAGPGQFQQAVEWALEAGYKHIDTASAYNNEKEVGDAISNKIKEGLVKREDLFITTKLWNDRHSEKAVVPALKESLARLNLDYVDLYLIHWPISVNANGEDEGIEHAETWRGMEKALELGLARSIGVSNFNEQQLQKLLETAKIKPAVNQFEMGVNSCDTVFTTAAIIKLVYKSNFYRPQSGRLLQKMSIIPVAYTPLGLISKARPEFAGIDLIKTDPKLGKIADKYNKSRAQIGLRYLIQRDIPVLPKSFTKSRIEENLNIFDFQLTEEEMQIVDSYNINHRCVPDMDKDQEDMSTNVEDDFFNCESLLKIVSAFSSV